MSTDRHNGRSRTSGPSEVRSNGGHGDHEEWDELAVGYALTALEPDELERFFNHLVESCPHCRQLVDDTTAIGAQIGTALAAPVEEISSDLRAQVLQAALEARPAVPQSPADIAAPTEAAVSRPPMETAPPGRIVVLDERRNRRLTGTRAGWLVAAAAAVIAMVLSVTTVAALHGRSQERSVADAQLRAINEITHGGTARVVPLRDDSGNNVATVVERAGSISVLAQKMPANSASTSYVLWGIKAAAGSDPTALGVFDVRGANVQATQVAADARGYSGFKTYAISHEPGHSPPTKPSAIVALGVA